MLYKEYITLIGTMSVILDGIKIIAQNPPSFRLFIPPPWGWFLLGLALCSVEYFLRHHIPKRYRFMALMAGLSAILMSMILFRLGHKYFIVWDTLMKVEGALTLQILFWMGLAFTFVFWVRPMFYRVKLSTMVETNEAETLTEIEPGKMGRVLYEGSSWQACCEYDHAPIPAHQKVYVLYRKDNILLVVSASND